MTRPAPLTPPDCDLRSLPYMPLDIDRLLDSDFNANASDAEWRTAITLWCKSFRRVPAGSLPAENNKLAQLAGLGRNITKFGRLRGSALRGWYECDDGLLYHRVVAEKVLEAWIERLKARKKAAAGNAKRWQATGEASEIDEALMVAGLLLSAVNPTSKRLVGLPSAIAQGSQEDRTRIAGGSQKDIAQGSHSDRKVEGVLTEQEPRQGSEDISTAEIVALPRTRTHARGEAGR